MVIFHSYVKLPEGSAKDRPPRRLFAEAPLHLVAEAPKDINWNWPLGGFGWMIKNCHIGKMLIQRPLILLIIVVILLGEYLKIIYKCGISSIIGIVVILIIYKWEHNRIYMDLHWFNGIWWDIQSTIHGASGVSEHGMYTPKMGVSWEKRMTYQWIWGYSLVNDTYSGVAV